MLKEQKFRSRFAASTTIIMEWLPHMTTYLKRAKHSYRAIPIHKYINTQMDLRSIVRPIKYSKIT